MFTLLAVAIPLSVIAAIARRRFRKNRQIARCRRAFRENYIDWKKHEDKASGELCIQWHAKLLRLGH